MVPNPFSEFVTLEGFEKEVITAIDVFNVPGNLVASISPTNFQSPRALTSLLWMLGHIKLESALMTEFLIRNLFSKNRLAET